MDWSGSNAEQSNRFPVPQRMGPSSVPGNSRSLEGSLVSMTTDGYGLPWVPLPSFLVIITPMTGRATGTGLIPLYGVLSSGLITTGAFPKTQQALSLRKDTLMGQEALQGLIKR